MKILSKTNDKTLKDLKNGLYQNFNDDALLDQVKDVLRRNRTVSKKAAIIISGYYDYFGRLNIAIPWLNGAAKRVEEVTELLLGYAPVFAELERQISEQNTRVAVLSEERPLNTLVMIWKDIGILSKKVVSFTKDAENICLASKNLRTLLSEKVICATRFWLTEQRLKLESSKVGTLCKYNFL